MEPLGRALKPPAGALKPKPGLPHRSLGWRCLRGGSALCQNLWVLSILGLGLRPQALNLAPSSPLAKSG